jgi:hypothetical protein
LQEFKEFKEFKEGSRASFRDPEGVKRTEPGVFNPG